MKKFLIFILFFFNLIYSYSQTTNELFGKYISKKRYSDVWTLILNSDSTYKFDSYVGESIFPGKWSINNKSLILSYIYKGETYNYKFAIIRKNNSIRLLGKTSPFNGMKLKKLIL
jgi:hypothetical protein